jgi:hypothetical protein
MVKICSNCGTENPEGAFWCSYCEKILLKEQSVDNYNPNDEKKKQLPEQQARYKSLYHYENRAIKYYIAGFIIFIVFIGIFIYLSLTMGSNFNWISCQFNEDFWFEEEKIITDDGWTFTMDRVQDYTLDGIVLAMNTYNRHDSPYDPCNIFCPIDLFIGVGDVKANPENYDYSIRSFCNRKICWYMQYDDYSDYQYFKTHTGNNHLIPHNEDVLNEMQNLSVNDRIIIKGGLVNLYGKRGEQTLVRTTDTQIGNYDCEAILVDELIIK